MRFIKCYALLLFLVLITSGQPQTEIIFEVQDGVEGSETLVAALDTSATEGIDTSLSESELPPPPPSGIFDARLELPTGAASLVDAREGSDNFGSGTEYILKWQLGDDASVFYIDWTLPGRTRMNIQDLNGGTVINESYEAGQGSLEIIDETIRGVKLIISGSTVTSVDNEKLPGSFLLRQNYPNPFNPSTTIEFTLPVKSDVTIKMYSTIGEEIQKLTNRNYFAGVHSINFNALNLPSGMYIYTIEAAGSNGKNFIMSRKMILLK